MFTAQCSQQKKKNINQLKINKDVDLGEMNTKLLEKIEELTLYIIDLQKQIDKLKK